MGLFKRRKKKETPQSKNGPFVSFVLLEDVSLDMDALIKNLSEQWGISIPETDIDKEKKSFVSTQEGMIIAASLMPAPVPNGEAVENAKTNWRWPQAVEVAEQHKAFLMLTVMGGEQALLDTALLNVKLCASGLSLKNATGINVLGSVLEPDFYVETAKIAVREHIFPIMNLVFFGLYSNDEGKTGCGYTYGMDAFGKQNIEIIDSVHGAEEVLAFMTDIAGYVITADVTLQDGETIGFTEEQKLTITQSAGVAIDEPSLKIGF